MSLVWLLRRHGRRVFPAHRRSGLIGSFAKLNVWYAKGIQVLAFIRNVEITDIGILMALAKYFAGDILSTRTIICLGAGYWIANTAVNLAVGWFWEHHAGWEIEARVRAKRVDPQRTILVDPESGKPYGVTELREALHVKPEQDESQRNQQGPVKAVG